MVMKPELRRRLIDSVEYLRKMGFFQDYSSLSSEEILEKIFNGEVICKTSWQYEKESEEELKRRWQELGIEPDGVLLKKFIEGHGDYYMKKSDVKIDFDLTRFGAKRVFVEQSEAIMTNGIGIAILKKLARISRGVFNPTNIREEFSKWSKREGKIPSVVKLEYSSGWGAYIKVFFEFREKGHMGEYF
jgi:hypothetical protein